MNTSKKNIAWMALFLGIFILSSCSSVSDLPTDDVYYSRNVKNTGEYDWDEFQKNAQSYNTAKASGSNQESEYAGSASGDIATTVTGVDADNDNQYIDEYYNSSYEDRINRFGTNSSNSGFGYYDGYNSGCNCGTSNWSVGFGMGFGGYGYGSGWSIGYGYGWPHNYYPSYGYGGSYWAGYNAGYNHGYYNGYWGYPYYGYPYYGYGGYPYYGGGYYGGYYGSYYPDYGITTPTVVYGPRSGGAGGTTIPRAGTRTASRNAGDEDNKTIIVGSRNGSATGNSDAITTRSASRGTGQIDQPVTSRSANSRSSGTVVAQEKLQKPTTTTNRTYERSATSSQNLPEPKYRKPKSYQSLPSQKPGSSSNFTRPSVKTPATRTTQKDPYVRTRKAPTNSRSINSSRSNSYTPSRSYSSPSRSTTSRSSYSSPSRSSSSFSRSSGSSRSGSGSVSRSSGSRSSSSGGGSSRR